MGFKPDLRTFSFYKQCLYRQSLESRDRPPVRSNHQCLFRSLEDLFACSRSSKIDFDALYIPDQNSSVGNDGLDTKASRYKSSREVLLCGIVTIHGLLHLESQQTSFRARDRIGGVTFALVETIATLIQIVDLVLTALQSILES